MPIMHLNAVLPFTDDIGLPACYEAPRDKLSKTGKLLIIDRSGSMQANEAEFKLTLSMVTRGLAGLDHIPAVPSPSGGTNLIGKVKQLVESGELGEQEVIIITDGLDNAHDINEFQVGINDAGEPAIVKVDYESYDSTEAYMKARQEAILKYLAFVGARVHLIGIGSEVKALLAMAGRHRMRATHIPQRATAAEVVAVVDAAVNSEPDAPLSREDFESTEEFEAEAERRVVTIARIGCRPAPRDARVQAVERTAAMVHVGENRFDEESFKEAFAAAEAAARIAECAKKYTRGVVLWLMRESLDKGHIPGAAIGSRMSKVFARPQGGDSEWRVNQLLHQLKTRGILTAKKEDCVAMELEGRSRTFKKVECYATSTRAAHLADALKNDASWATPTSELIIATSKRARDGS